MQPRLASAVYGVMLTQLRRGSSGATSHNCAFQCQVRAWFKIALFGFPSVESSKIHIVRVNQILNHVKI